MEAGQEEGQRKPRRASSWSPIQLGDGEEGGRHSLGELYNKSRSGLALAFSLKQIFHFYLPSLYLAHNVHSTTVTALTIANIYLVSCFHTF